ncbi:MAG TPA: hypothetical protein VID27_19755 [Blastocatellia bacterium]
MKKLISTTAAITSSLLVVLAASEVEARLQATSKKTDREEAGFIGPVQIVQARTAFLLSEDGKPPEEIPALLHKIEYDAAGHEIAKGTYFRDGSPDTGSTTKYDPRGNVIERTYFVHGSPTFRHVITYDEKDREILAVEYHPNGSVWNSHRTVYKLEGRLKETTEYSSQEIPQGKTETLYDDKGRIVEEKRYRHGSLERKCAYTYKAKGNEEEESACCVSKGSTECSKQKYIYDDKSRIVEKQSYRQNLLTGRETAQYDSAGNVIEEIKYDGKGNIEEKSTFKYLEFDSRGNWLKAIVETDSKYSKSSMGRKIVWYRVITYFGGNSVAAIGKN